MGHNTSKLKVHVEASVPAGACRIDAVSLSYGRTTCWGQSRRRVARFAFPRKGWACLGGVEVCPGAVQRLSLEELRREDGDAAVRLKCTARSVRVHVTSMPLARLLALLEGATVGGKAFLHFALEGGADAFTALWCNGWCSVDDGDAWEGGGDGDEEFPGPKDDSGSGMLSSPGRQGIGRCEEENVPNAYDKLGLSQPDAASEGEQCPAGTGHCDTEDETVPEIDLGDPSSLEFLYSLLDGKVPKTDSGVPPPSVLDAGTVPEIDLGDPSSLAFLNGLLNGTVYGGPGTGVQADETVPEIDLGDPSSLAFLNRLLYGAVPETVYGVPETCVQADDTVPEVDLGDPSSLAFLNGPLDDTVPEVDLGDPSSLAFLNDLLDDTVPEVDLGDPSSLAFLNGLLDDTVPEVDLGDPSSVAFLNGLLDDTVPEVDLGDPSSLAFLNGLLDDTVPEVDLGDPSSLAFLNGLLDGTVPDIEYDDPEIAVHDDETVPEIDLGEPSSLALLHGLTVQDSETVPEVDLGEPSSLALLHGLTVQGFPDF